MGGNTCGKRSNVNLRYIPEPFLRAGSKYGSILLEWIPGRIKDDQSPLLRQERHWNCNSVPRIRNHSKVSPLQ